MIGAAENGCPLFVGYDGVTDADTRPNRICPKTFFLHITRGILYTVYGPGLIRK